MKDITVIKIISISRGACIISIQTIYFSGSINLLIKIWLSSSGQEYFILNIVQNFNDKRRVISLLGRRILVTNSTLLLVSPAGTRGGYLTQKVITSTSKRLAMVQYQVGYTDVVYTTLLLFASSVEKYDKLPPKILFWSSKPQGTHLLVLIQYCILINYQPYWTQTQTNKKEDNRWRDYCVKIKGSLAR